MSQQFRITFDNQDHFFKILEPHLITHEADEMTLEVNQEQVVKLKKVNGNWENLNSEFFNIDLIQGIIKTIRLRFRV